MRRASTIIAMMLAMAVQGQTREQVLSEIKRQGIPHPHIVLAQARLETGNFKSDRCRRDKNLFGMKRGRRYATYRHWRDSVRDYKQRISSRYKGGDYYTFLERIGYASDPNYNRKVRKIVKTSNQ
jgi:flagellum-specific peptidoglycan hydrolase FlgJ